MSARLITDTSQVKPNLNVRTWDIIIDNDGSVAGNLDVNTINGQAYPPGGEIPTLVANKVLVTTSAPAPAMQWGSVGPQNLTGGSVNDVLKTIAPSTVAWDSLKPGDLTPGLARQLLQTNSAATAAEWTSNIDIPGTLDCTGNAVFDGDLTVTNDLNIVNGDVTLANGGLSVLVDGISIEGNSSFNNDLNIDGEITLNFVSGTANQTIVSDGAGNQIWSSVPASGIAPGTAFQVLQTNSLGTASVWVDNIFVPGTITATGNLSSVNGGLTLSHINAQINMSGASTQINCGGATTTNTLNVLNNLQFNSVSGTSGQFLKKTGATSQSFQTLAASDTKGGSLNQVLQSDGSGGVFNSNVIIPGTLTSTSTFTASAAANIVGNLQFNSVSGSSGQFVKKTGASTQAFANIVASDITAGSNGQVLLTSGGVSTWGSIPTTLYFQRYYNNTTINVNTGTNVFSTTGVQQVNSNSPFTFNTGTGTFTCAVAGTYRWTFATILSTHDAQSKFLISDGTNILCAQQTDYLPGITSAQPFTYTGTFAATVGQIWAVGFASFGVGGVMNSSGADATFSCPTTTLEIARI